MHVNIAGAVCTKNARKILSVEPDYNFKQRLAEKQKFTVDSVIVLLEFGMLIAVFGNFTFLKSFK